MEVRYITNPNGNGWILAVPAGVLPSIVAMDPGKGLSLPWCLKVELLDVSGGREWFKILEGAEANKKASVKMKSSSESYLSKSSPHKEAGLVKLSRAKQQLWYGKQGPFNAFTETSNPIPPGRYDIEIPDAPHANYYSTYSKYEQVWFRIGHSGDRYLHLGTISHGCATVRPFIPDKKKDARFLNRSDEELGLPATTTQFADWDDLCQYLMCRRAKDGKSVGTLHVTD